jgi:LPS-assembly protein
VTRFINTFLLALCAVLLLAAVPGLSAEIPTVKGDSGPVSLNADSLSYDKGTDTYHATGDVHLQQGGVELQAASISWNRNSGDAEASGGVRLTGPEGVMEGDSLSYNLETGRGRLNNGRVFTKGQSFHIAGREIEKLGAQEYRVQDGTFTTCEGDPPSWKFGAGNFGVTLGGYARASNVLFYLRDVPVLYIPYLVYPAKTERESGLLLPRYGFSTRRGTQFSLAWYQVLARNLDATFELDYMSKFGLGKGLEYRYVLGDDNQGVFHAYHVTEGGHTDRYSLTGRHRGTLPADVHLAADVDFVSSRDYYADFGEDYNIYTRDKAETVVYLARNWDKINLAGQFKYLKDLEQSGEGTLQRLPEVRLAGLTQRLDGTPLFLRYDLEGEEFWRRKGEKGARLSLHPVLSTDLLSNPLFSLVPEIGYRERFYSTTRDDFQTKGVFDFGARASTLFSRVYGVAGQSVRKIRHSIEPEIGYSYIPGVDQSTLPEFDSLDRIGPENRISYSLTNRFTARIESESGEPYYHEFLYLRLSQSYDFDKFQEPLDPPENVGQPFSPLLLEAIIRPNRWSFLDFDASYDTNSGENRLVDYNLNGSLTDTAGNKFTIDYRNRRGELNYLGATLETSLLKPVYVRLADRYDFFAGKALESIVGLEYRSRCWSFFVTYRQRPEEEGVVVAFSLSGIGRVADLGASRPRTTEQTAGGG